MKNTKKDNEELNEKNVILLKKYKEAKRKKEKMEIMNLIVENNTRIAKKIASTYYIKCNLKGTAIDVEDLEQEAFIGIVAAVEKFNHSANTRFLTYSHWWIKQKIIRYIQNAKDVIRIPAYILQESSRIYKMESENEYFSELKYKVDKDTVDSSKNKVVNLEDSLSKEDGLNLHDRISCCEDVEEDNINSMNLKKLMPKIKKVLTEREYKVIFERFINEKTLQEISNDMNVTRERIRQIEKKALEKLREGINREEFE